MEGEIKKVKSEKFWVLFSKLQSACERLAASRDLLEIELINVNSEIQSIEALIEMILDDQ